MRCILACDLKGGIVVKGVRGERDKYGPIDRSSLVVDTSGPLDVIAKIQPKETYIADLDRIMGVGDNLAAIKTLSGMTRTMADIGVSSVADFDLAGSVSGSVVVGTETAPLDVIERCQGPRAIVSLDMKNGKMMGQDPAFQAGPMQVLKLLNRFEIGAVILLDVGRVGSGAGVDAQFVTSAVSASKHAIILGGGVRGVEDLELLETCGASGAIVASAVHDGRIPLDMLRY
ncbi:MAG TPA: HisA/HisF-related TIM barrel protein [Methanocella sp.]|uniref:HisA/HisF-related TIM barrel protein n=1 Tax=Methanocella sp. TaxID=2052833 RepID=UPI002BD1C56F|nr:HisA/HisF-related TIM barrel protein [Methanocella sp.]HTY90721.1 HisA/HisF-related TIM barrel protein [Methanocella sp.]